MIRYTKRYINTISLIISIIILFLFNNLCMTAQKINFNEIFLASNFENVQNEISNLNLETQEKKEEDTKEKIENEEIKSPEENNAEEQLKSSWRIEIPKISLTAEISEGTTKEVMDKFVGHFEETSKDKGNIGLAAHNRGYPVNYFENLKKLNEGDEIIYYFDSIKKVYIVTAHKIIKDTDWTMLEASRKNIITLITCVENEPSYRRCIQALEKE